MTLDDVRTLFEFNYWAKARLMSVLETLSDEQFVKDLGSSHGGIHGTLVHIVGAENIWLSGWTDQTVLKLLDRTDYPTLADVRKKWDDVEREMREFISNLTEENISAVVRYKTTEGKQFSYPLWQIMQHVVNHSSYHRGQIVTMLRQLGIKPMGTDLIAFYRGKQS
jgi:uncharacterized damage-inducible protein DinB